MKQVMAVIIVLLMAGTAAAGNVCDGYTQMGGQVWNSVNRSSIDMVRADAVKGDVILTREVVLTILREMEKHPKATIQQLDTVAVKACNAYIAKDPSLVTQMNQAAANADKKRLENQRAQDAQQKAYMAPRPEEVAREKAEEESRQARKDEIARNNQAIKDRKAAWHECVAELRADIAAGKTVDKNRCGKLN